MQSLNYVYAAYACGLIFIMGYGLYVLRQRRQLRSLILTLEEHDEAKE